MLYYGVKCLESKVVDLRNLVIKFGKATMAYIAVASAALTALGYFGFQPKENNYALIIHLCYIYLIYILIYIWFTTPNIKFENPKILKITDKFIISNNAEWLSIGTIVSFFVEDDSGLEIYSGSGYVINVQSNNITQIHLYREDIDIKHIKENKERTTIKPFSLSPDKMSQDWEKHER